MATTPKQTPISKPRNFVAKNATTSGAGAHTDKKRSAKQGEQKHKNKAYDMAEGRWINGPGGVPLERRGNPKAVPQKAEPKLRAPNLTLNDVWRKVEDVVGQIFPDGDPIDWVAPWLKRQGVEDFKIGNIITRAARKNGYKDMYDYWNQLKQQHDADQRFDNDSNYAEDINQFKDILNKQHVPPAAPKAATRDEDFNGWTIRIRPASNAVQWGVLDRRGDLKNTGQATSVDAARADAKQWITSGGGQVQQSTNNVTIDFNVAFARQFAPEGESFFANIDQDNGQPVLIFSTERHKGFKASAIRTQKDKITSGTVRLPCITMSPREANTAKLVPNGRYILGDQDQIDDNTYMYPLIYQSTVQGKGDVMQLKQPGLTVATSRAVGEEQVSELAPATYKNYIVGRKQSPSPISMRAGIKQVQGVRSAKEKLRNQEIDTKAKSLGDPRVAEAAPLRKKKIKESYTDWLHNVLNEVIAKKK